MGEMACYQDTCPECGKVPPNRKTENEKDDETLNLLQNLVTIMHMNGIIHIIFKQIYEYEWPDIIY